MSHRFRPRLAFALIVIASLALTACNKTVKRVSEPAASVQELTVRADGRISVHNACRVADGDRVAADGVARPVEGHPGQLQVRFVPDWLSWVPLVWADYWVIALDPGYQWAVVGEPDRKYLWILSRSPSMDTGLFEQLKARAEAMGYDLAPLRVMAPLD